MLSPEKLRLLTFPQRIDGLTLEIRVLVLPTQSLLNELAPFPSVAAPGTTVMLPKFIGGSLSLVLDAIQGVATYPFSDPVLLAADGATLRSLATDAAFPGDLPALYETLAGHVTIVSGNGTAPPAADPDGIRKFLPSSYRTAFNFTNPRTPFAQHRRLLSLCHPPHQADRHVPEVQQRRHLGTRGRLLPPAAAAGRAHGPRAQADGHAARG